MSSLGSLLLFLYSNYIEQREYCRSILGCNLKPRHHHHHHQPRTPRVTGASTIASKPKATWGPPPSGRNTLTHTHTNHADSASAGWSLVPHIPQLDPLLLHRVPLNRRIASTVLRIPLDSTFGECNCCGADSESIILAVSGRRQEKQTTLRRCHCLRYSACLLQYPTSNHSSLFESPETFSDYQRRHLDYYPRKSGESPSPSPKQDARYQYLGSTRRGTSKGTSLSAFPTAIVWVLFGASCVPFPPSTTLYLGTAPEAPLAGQFLRQHYWLSVGR